MSHVNYNKILNVMLVTLLTSLAAGLSFLFIENKTIKGRIDLQTVKANTIMGEIGETRKESNILYQKFLQSESNVKALSESLEKAKSGNFIEYPNAKVLRMKRPELALGNAEEMPQTRNFLVVGHNQHLADSIVVAAVNAETRKITLISVPRDLFVDGRKVNEYMPLYGVAAFKEKIEKVLGLSMEGYFVFDFDAFKELIDGLEGIDIHVSKSIYDPFYPAADGKYQVYRIEPGSHHMSGEEALKYARSRHSTSDFDRARRQQQIIGAIHDRIINLNFLEDFDQIKRIFYAISAGLETDASVMDLAGYIKDFKSFSVAGGNVISTSNYLYSSTTAKGQYILLPFGGNFEKIHGYIRGVLRGE